MFIKFHILYLYMQYDTDLKVLINAVLQKQEKKEIDAILQAFIKRNTFTPDQIISITKWKEFLRKKWDQSDTTRAYDTFYYFLEHGRLKRQASAKPEKIPKDIPSLSTLIYGLEFRRAKKYQRKIPAVFEQCVSYLTAYPDQYNDNNKLLRNITKLLHMYELLDSAHQYVLPQLIPILNKFLLKTYAGKKYKYNRWIVAPYYIRIFKGSAEEFLTQSRVTRENIDTFLIRTRICNNEYTAKNLLSVYYQNTTKIAEKLKHTRIIIRDDRHLFSVKSNDFEEITTIFQTLQTISDTHYRNPYAFAYTKGQSIVTCANKHRGSRFILHLDLKHFYESITTDMLETELAVHLPPHQAKEIAEICTYDNKLRLGTITSPILSNMIGYKLDQLIATEIKDHYSQLIYTRYSDDLIFSSHSPEKFDIDTFIAQIQNICGLMHLRLNRKKTSFVTGQTRMKVLSVILNQNQFSVSKQYRQKLRSAICHLQDDDLNFNSMGYYSGKRAYEKFIGKVKKIQGQLAYIYSINPSQCRALYQKLTPILAQAEANKPNR